MTAALELDDVRAGYGRIQVLHGRRASRCRPARWSRCSGPTASARPPPCGPSRARCRSRPGAIRLDGRRIDNRRPSAIAAEGVAPRAGGPRRVPRAQRAGQPPRRPPQRAARPSPAPWEEWLGGDHRDLPAPRRAAGPDRRVAVRRRAADARRVPGARSAIRASCCSTSCRWASRRSSWPSCSSGWPTLRDAGPHDRARRAVPHLRARARRPLLRPRPRAGWPGPASPASSAATPGPPPSSADAEAAGLLRSAQGRTGLGQQCAFSGHQCPEPRHVGASCPVRGRWRRTPWRRVADGNCRWPTPSRPPRRATGDREARLPVGVVKSIGR